MRLILLVLLPVALLSISCEKETTAVQTHDYNERASGEFSLGVVNALVVGNVLGPVIVEGSSDSVRVGWFLDKWVTAESQAEASQTFPQIHFNLQTTGDTAYGSVHGPGGTSSYSALLSLTIPAHVPCILRDIKGSIDLSYLDTSLVGEDLGVTTIHAHMGNCVLRGGTGDASVEVALPDSGTCLVNLIQGNITLKIPTATSSILTAQTTKGTITYSGLVLADTVRTDTSLAGKLGTSRGKIQLSTGEGNIVITGF